MQLTKVDLAKPMQLQILRCRTHDRSKVHLTSGQYELNIDLVLFGTHVDRRPCAIEKYISICLLAGVQVLQGHFPL